MLSLLLAAPLPCLLQGSPLEVPPAWEVESLGSVEDVQLEGSVLAYRQRESVAGADFNGDGDFGDRVWAFARADGGVVTPGLAAASVQLAGTSVQLVGTDAGEHPFALVRVTEAGQGGTDLDGNGEVDDFVYALVDLESGAVSFVPSEQTAGVTDVSTFGDEGVLFARSEQLLGFQSGFDPAFDLDGDGDFDTVYWFWRRATGTGTAVTEANPIADGERILPGGRVLLVGLEPPDGVDLNGDGDAGDWVRALYDPASGQLAFLPWATRQAGFLPEIESTEGLPPSFLLIPESNQGGQDLNGDGDADDEVLHLALPALPVAVPLGYAVSRLVRDDDDVAFALDEDGKFDLNGDGDRRDSVLQIVSTGGGSIDTGVAVDDGLEPLRMAERLVIFGADEEAQGAGDLDGNGFVGSFVAALDRTTGAFFALPGVAVAAGREVEGALTAFVRLESGATGDLDGNGELNSVLYLLDVDAAPDQEFELVQGLPLGFGLTSGTLVTGANELLGATDYDLDGDLDDVFLRFEDLGAGTLQWLDWPVVNVVGSVGDQHAVRVSELDFGDIDGDGVVTQDDVLVLLRRR